MRTMGEDESERLRSAEFDFIDRTLMGDDRSRTLFDWSPEAIVIVNRQGIFLDANKKLYEWLGYKPAEVIGKHILELPFLPDKTKEIIKENFVQRMQGKDISAYEAAFLHKDGTEKWGEIHGAFLRDNTNNITVDLIMVSDITERKCADESLRRLAAIVESSDDGIIGKTLDGIITSWNPGAEKIYGYFAEEVIGRPISLLLPLEYPDEITKLLERIKHGEHVHHFETMRMRKDGKRIYVSLSVSPIKDGTNNIVGASTIARDITEKKKMEGQLKENEEKFRLLFENTYDLIQSVDEQGKFIDVNPRWLETLEYSRDEVKKLRLTDIVRKDQISHCQEILKMIFQGKHSKNIETVFLSKTGKEIVVEGNAHGLFLDGKFIGTVGIFQEISGAKKN
ncbi:MAG: PAS domain S-box protein [Euryarchaeota archaeon]|nr:PAS domain S-box protein [Euryarchaeota archaeon]